MINSDLLAFTLGGPEVIIVLVLILLLFGAKRIPKLAKSIGQATGELKKGRLESEREISDAKKSSEGEESSKQE